MTRIEDFPEFESYSRIAWNLNPIQKSIFTKWLREQNVHVEPNKDILNFLDIYSNCTTSTFTFPIEIWGMDQEILPLLTLIKPNKFNNIAVKFPIIFHSMGFYHRVIGILIENGWDLSCVDGELLMKYISENNARISKLEAEIAALSEENAELRMLPPGIGGPDYEAAKSRFYDAAAQQLNTPKP